MNIKNMSLRCQLNGVIVSILVICFIGSLWINIFNTQTFLNDQLSSHAQDTATSLGLSLSEPIFNEEEVVVEASINAIFDRGYYHHITLESVDGVVLYQRLIENQPEQVPIWFINIFTLTAPEKQTMIDTGWTVGGILKVQSHTGLAYEQLWESTKDITHATLFIFVLTLLLAYLFLQKMYRPISAISQQAAAVQKRQFVMIDHLPNAIELRHFVIAMNKMVANIKSTFDELTEDAAKIRRVAYIDPQTEVENRRAFLDAMDELLAESAQHSGYLVMVRLTELTALNKKLGYQAGDSLVLQVVEQIKTVSESNRECKVYRISGSEFCLFLENCQHKHIKQLVKDLSEQMDQKIEHLEEMKIAVGSIHFSSDQQFSDLMYELDMATNLAIESGEGFHIKQSNKADCVTHINNLKTVLDEILLNPDSHIHLNGQILLTCSERAAFDIEIFAAFEYQGKVVNTGDLFAIASQYQQTGVLDLTIIRLILSLCKRQTFQGKRVAINLSRLTLSDASSMNKIITLIKQSKLGNVLTIGLPESAILGHVEESKLFVDKLKEEGCSICINRFGSSMASLQYLMGIQADQVKLSPAFTRNIEQKENNAQIVSAFVRMVHGLDITVIAQCVETEQELAFLKSLNIDAALGYVIDKPTQL